MAQTANRRTIGLLVGVAVITVLAFVLGTLLLQGSGAKTEQQVGSVGGVAPVAPDVSYDASAGGSRSSLGDAKAADSLAPLEPMVVRTASVEIRVKAIDPAISRIRSAAKVNGADITDVSVQKGIDPGPIPLGAEARVPSPSSATITLRVASDKLDALRADIEKVGTVLTQSTSSNDVTQQYVDMAARLKNLKAEEARLRGFFTRATKVSDLLEVEKELSRVRGEIESLQAQVDYLKRQVDKATLTVSLTEPGPVVQPSGTSWGFLEAVTRGIQGAVAVLTTLITGLIAVAPVVVLLALAWLVIRAVRRRRSPGESPADDREETL